MLNHFVVIGRLTKDLELGKTSNDVSYLNFDIAVDNVRKDANGEHTTSFFRVKCFNNIAENVAKHLAKGSKVAVVGSIEQVNWLAQDGSKRSSYEVIANSVEFLDPKKADEEASEEPKKEPQQKFDPYTGKPISKTNKK